MDDLNRLGVLDLYLVIVETTVHISIVSGLTVILRDWLWLLLLLLGPKNEGAAA